MKLKLDDLEFELNDVSVQSEDVSVDFEYEELLNQNLKVFLDCYVGNTDVENVYRFRLKLIYIINMSEVVYQNENDMLEKALNILIGPLGDLIGVLDHMIKEKEERQE